MSQSKSGAAKPRSESATRKASATTGEKEAQTKTAWTVSAPCPEVTRISIPCATSSVFSVLCMSDEHWDNAHCDLGLLKKHHEEAKAIGAPILKFGDTLCLMQGKWDKRADQNALREEHRGNHYLDKVIETASEWYAPYAENIVLISPGNHEQSISQRHQTDMTERLCERLRANGSHTRKGTYAGFILFDFRRGNIGACTKSLFYHHGYGGGGEITRGLIDNSRTRGQYNADIFYSGHIHRRNMDENVIIGVNKQNGQLAITNQIFLRGSTYKREEAGLSGWHVTKGRSARPVGGWWLDFKISRDASKNTCVDIVERRAI